MKHELIIIGGGAAGITAAITAKDMGIDTAIIESNSRIGKKILSTGNGRCNITNENITLEKYHSKNTNFFEPVLTYFTNLDTINLFKMLGLPLITLDDGKMYPMSLQASSVLDILRSALEERQIPVYLDTNVSNINYSKNNFKLVTNSDTTYECTKLILCCGGKSASKTGSDGSGFNLAKKLGHSIIEPLPALVQLKLNHSKLKALSGVKFEGTAEIFVDNKSIKKEDGEILFTNYGISGPPILQLSRNAAYAIYQSKKVTLKLDMINNLSLNELENFLENHWGIFGYRSVHDSLVGIINKKIIPILLKESGIDNMHKSCWELTYLEKKNIYNLLKNWSFEVIGTNGFNNSQVTAGGINTKEINPNTLESKIIPNLYFAGEILDVDGDCGGFNLQWAWACGSIAARNAAIK
ncbi:NAD(P)/FAD-dependent oxidoreductase [Clostridium aestuarii]|uniref:NAD(P)/FAD-dependent oxidoreductase n=1 Tax=Clostridium aestuarii TaxID=338193 RepID=A0ABT4D2G0_9CLOT|nr:NAD(P)/FAD-dependent oxidoreductase [Clostridium aestuarii]MCY6485292.1 NAD(P)/FAD-dependent oxidoreductase [Clostridium aestuarii]